MLPLGSVTGGGVSDEFAIARSGILTQPSMLNGPAFGGSRYMACADARVATPNVRASAIAILVTVTIFASELLR